MTEGLLSPDEAARLVSEAITPTVLLLVSEGAPSRVILGAGGGVFAVTHIAESPGIYFAEDERGPEAIARRRADILDPAGVLPLHDTFSQSRKYTELSKAG